MNGISHKPVYVEELLEKKRRPVAAPAVPRETAFGCPRDFLDNRFVYVVLSPRARGLSVGVNMNPDRLCDFDCIYCEVNRSKPSRETELDTAVMAHELERTLAFVASPQFRELSPYHNLPAELLRLHHVTISGDGEPTLSPYFLDAVRYSRKVGYNSVQAATNGIEFAKSWGSSLASGSSPTSSESVDITPSSMPKAPLWRANL